MKRVNLAGSKPVMSVEKRNDHWSVLVYFEDNLDKMLGFEMQIMFDREFDDETYAELPDIPGYVIRAAMLG